VLRDGRIVCDTLDFTQALNSLHAEREDESLQQDQPEQTD
jgi:hypothetical protein